MDVSTLAIDTADKRRDPRFLVDENFQVKILFSSDNPKALGQTFTCAAVDVSKNGLQITCRDPLAIKSVLDLSITIKDSARSYSLTGNVKWCKPTIGIAHTVGIQLRHRAGTATDLADWKKLIKQLK
ncbi:MAG: PilZ domain-containing protein [Gammaproteobacteria bacterium]|nr:PilZ domain-containing protein [Gammaproteobacteria bacterium]